MSRSGRLVAVIGAVACAVAMLGTAPVVAAPSPSTHAAQPTLVATPAVSSPIPRAELCRRPLSRLELFRGSSGFVMPSTLTILNETVNVDLKTFNLDTVPFQDPSRILWYRSLLWLALAAVNSAENGQGANAYIAAMAMIRAATAHPDPGSATPQALAKSRATGWDEGTTFRRAEALLCLSSATGVAPVRALLKMHAESLLDPNRYYGPPQRPVHNHGMLTNLVLMDLASVLNEPRYRTIALQRLANDYKTVFSPDGWSREGSTSYHSVNVNGWREAQDQLRVRGYASDAAALGADLDAATDVAAHLVGPSGLQALIGDSRPTDVVLRPGATVRRALTMNDQDGGLAVGRWSWTDSATSWWTALNRPQRGAHGHDDKTSITWQTGGLPVLVDPGQPDYDTAVNPFTIWSRTPEAHNRSIPARKSHDDLDLHTTDVSRTGPIDTVVMTSSDRGPEQTREVIIDDQRRTLQVSDSVHGRQTQYWHFDARWKVQSIGESEAVLVAPNGQLMLVAAPGASISLIYGTALPMGGWQTTGFEKVVPAPELLINGGPDITTTFRMARSLTTGVVPVPRVTKLSTPANRRVGLDLAFPGTRKKSAAVPRSVKGFRVQVKEPGSGWRTALVDGPAAAHRVTVGGLENGVVYRFRAAALSARSNSPYGPGKKLVPRTVPGKVSAPTARPVGRKRVRIRWVAPTEDGGARVTGFTVRADKKEYEVRREVLTLPFVTHALKVKIAAVNAAGSGKLTNVRLVRSKNGSITIR